MTNKQFVKKLGKRIIELREKKNLSQAQFSKKLKGHQGTLHKIENGAVVSTVLMLRKIAKALGVPLHKLIDVK